MTKRVEAGCFRYGWAALVLGLLTAPAASHESWVDPEQYRVPVAQSINADIRVGQHFKGPAYSYNPSEFVELSVIDANGKRPIRGRLGDQPAIAVGVRTDGLHTLVYQSSEFSLTYASFEKFQQFVRREGVEWVLTAHRGRGLPEQGFTEGYRRFAKALVKVGDGAGQDRAVGMPFELVAIDNPYTAPLDRDITVQLLWQGKPLPSIQVSIYRKRAGHAATRSIVHTDAQGKATVARATGGRFLLNAVHMVQGSGDRSGGTVWQSLWASMTFELPETGS